MAILAPIIAFLFEALLKHLAARADMRAAVLLKLERDEHRRALEAALWLAAHPITLGSSGLSDFASLPRVPVGPSTTPQLSGDGPPSGNSPGTYSPGFLPESSGGRPDVRGDPVG